MKPNIFNIATKELNQDAFLTWLLQYSDIGCKNTNTPLNKCGKEFITSLIQTQIPNFDEEIVNVEAGRQWQNIDVWAAINEKYLIIIEDKTFSSFHSNQLERYKQIAVDWCLEKKYIEPICVYLKTGNESMRNLDFVIKQGFSIFQRQDFLKILEKYTEIENDIFTDFKERLTKLEHSNNQYSNKIIGDWNGADWQGFYQFLETEIGLVNWHYVNNQNGGFWNAVLNWDYWDIFPVYLQIEQGNLCFKISTDPEELEMPKNITRSQIRNKIYHLITENAKKEGLDKVKRPDRFGHGKYMTAAIVKKHNWLGKKDDKIDAIKIAETLKEYKKFLKRTVEKTAYNNVYSS
ncbi:PD-(D/E)XK nuclease family protein [Leeuwenhoekiella sp. MAR_2009_132]|uniref:PD-(D/E)XK nuclease family protein n=1 Tax=Leeuwenhoekiella sp. MAR_2009_132 TaxID=1392489 RepID=UPI00048A47EE|nr:PD-(D/E)XK nuclease family protein [Leeuwenhoekiella sp. MAR_2009_132]